MVHIEQVINDGWFIDFCGLSENELEKYKLLILRERHIF